MLNIYVGNLSFDTTEDELRELFSEYGEVIKVSLISDRMTGRSRGFGFVEMATDAEARTAIEQLNGQDFLGRALTVNEAKPREDQPRRPGGSSGPPRGRR